MTVHAGLDVSDKATHVCVVDSQGRILWRGVSPTDPQAIAAARVTLSYWPHPRHTRRRCSTTCRPLTP